MAGSVDLSVEAIRAAAERLAERLRFRHAHTADGSACAPGVPMWWRQGMAGRAIFGDGLLSLPGTDDDPFSRPVALFTASEMSVAAGGEYVPLAWIHTSHSADPYMVVVHDRAQRGVLMVPPDGSEAARPVADSLTAFLDALEPQTLCHLSGPRNEDRRIEICGDCVLRIEHSGLIEERSLSSDLEVGAYVAKFLSDAIRDGFRVVACPARMRPVIAAFSRQAAARTDRSMPPEERARQALERLRAAEMLDLVDQARVEPLPGESPGELLEDLPEDLPPEDLPEDLIDDAGRFIERYAPSWPVSGRPSLGFVRRFAEWLIEHPAVDDLYADDEAVADAFAWAEHQRSERVGS